MARKFGEPQARTSRVAPLLVGASPSDEHLQVAICGPRGATGEFLAASALAYCAPRGGAGHDIHGLATLGAIGGTATIACVVPCEAADLPVAQVDDEVRQGCQEASGRVDLGARHVLAPGGQVQSIGAVQGCRGRFLCCGGPCMHGQVGILSGELGGACQDELGILLHLDPEDHLFRRGSGQEDAEQHGVPQRQSGPAAVVAGGVPFGQHRDCRICGRVLIGKCRVGQRRVCRICGRRNPEPAVAAATAAQSKGR
mmetsp:Transcript_48563/g.104054  ORF Transcript_48563/g.104054 Transcript_48563/m.104054 type:complete len:255 (-) Transcript_48563:47-811(-)